MSTTRSSPSLHIRLCDCKREMEKGLGDESGGRSLVEMWDDMVLCIAGAFLAYSYDVAASNTPRGAEGR